MVEILKGLVRILTGSTEPGLDREFRFDGGGIQYEIQSGETGSNSPSYELMSAQVIDVTPNGEFVRLNIDSLSGRVHDGSRSPFVGGLSVGLYQESCEPEIHSLRPGDSVVYAALHSQALAVLDRRGASTPLYLGDDSKQKPGAVLTLNVEPTPPEGIELAVEDGVRDFGVFRAGDEVLAVYANPSVLYHKPDLSARFLQG